MKVEAQSASVQLDADIVRFFNDPVFYQTAHHPGGLFDRLRAIDPVYRSAAGVWMITGFDAAQSALRDANFSMRQAALETAQLTFDAPAGELYLSRMGTRDGADHTRMRKLATPSFHPPGVRDWFPVIDTLLEEILDEVAARGRVELVSQVARELPKRFICRMLGIPTSELPRLEHWVIGLIARRNVASATDTRAEMSQLMLEFAAFLREFADERRKHPGRDVITQLIQAHDTGESLNDNELLAFCQELISGGVDTTANVIASGIWLLLNRPEQLAAWRAEPGLIAGAVEEILRFEPATLYGHPRQVSKEINLAGRGIPPNERIIVAIAGANRDPARFEDPHRFDLRRKPVSHLGFGFGAHFCLGAQIARAEIVATLTRFFQRFPRIELEPETFRWSDHPRMHGPGQYYVTCMA
ncbi:MAG: cytochrome P450 [Steroidobacteraceae bacterium]